MKLEIGDYFTSRSIIRVGEANWNLIRTAIEQQGLRVEHDRAEFSKTGNYDYLVINTHKLLVASATSHLNTGRCIVPEDFLHAIKPKEKIKLGVYNQFGRLSAGIDHLLSMGYKFSPFTNREEMVSRHQTVWGVYGNPEGIINTVRHEGTFSGSMLDYTEYSFDVKEVTTIVIENLFKVPKFVNVQGVQVNEDVLNAFLETQRNAAKDDK